MPLGPLSSSELFRGERCEVTRLTALRPVRRRFRLEGENEHRRLPHQRKASQESATPTDVRPLRRSTLSSSLT